MPLTNTAPAAHRRVLHIMRALWRCSRHKIRQTEITYLISEIGYFNFDHTRFRFDSSCTEVCSRCFKYKYASIDSDNGWAPNMRQPIVENNDGLVYWRMYVYPDLNEYQLQRQTRSCRWSDTSSTNVWYYIYIFIERYIIDNCLHTLTHQ